MPSRPYENRVLSRLSAETLQQLAPHLKPVKLDRGRALTVPNRNVRYAYFLESGLASIVTTMSDGTSVEVAVVGKEGMAGIPLLLDSGSMPNRTFMQIGGSGHRLEAKVLVTEFERSADLRQLLQHYFHAHLVQASQTAACNRLHEIAQRLARWLLLSHDRVCADGLEITHQSLAEMLGTPRPTVTLAARVLQKRGAIDYARGRVTIYSRKRLEECACECYEAIRRESRRLEVL